MVKRYVQEQAITTLAMVADASEATFVKVSQASNFFHVTLTKQNVSALLNDHAAFATCPVGGAWPRVQHVEGKDDGMRRPHWSVSPQAVS